MLVKYAGVQWRERLFLAHGEPGQMGDANAAYVWTVLITLCNQTSFLTSDHAPSRRYWETFPNFRAVQQTLDRVRHDVWQKDAYAR